MARRFMTARRFRHRLPRACSPAVSCRWGCAVPWTW